MGQAKTRPCGRCFAILKWISRKRFLACSWAELYQTGYLTKASPNENGSPIGLTIPNKEVRKTYEDSIIGWMLERSDTSQASNVIASLLSHNADDAARLLSKHLLESMSFFDYK